MFFKVIYRDPRRYRLRVAELIEAVDMGVAVLKAHNKYPLKPILVAEFDRKVGHAVYSGYQRCSP